MINPKTLLLVEDEQSIADALVFSLEQEGYSIIWCSLGFEALKVLDQEKIDLVVLDIGLPDITGFDLCKMIKAKEDLPIIFLTARQEEVDKLIGLEIGGDDYITKPFSLREVASRIKVILNRYNRVASQYEAVQHQSIQHQEKSNCTIDLQAMSITYFNEVLELTRYEYLLLKILIESPNRVYSRDVLMQNVWDEPDRSFERSVDTHIKTLRSKLKKVNAFVQPIKTHHGLGYSFNDKEVA
jgi:two-component system catabolic regulation response regulator CreB